MSSYNQQMLNPQWSTMFTNARAQATALAMAALSSRTNNNTNNNNSNQFNYSNNIMNHPNIPPPTQPLIPQQPTNNIEQWFQFSTNPSTAALNKDTNNTQMETINMLRSMFLHYNQNQNHPANSIPPLNSSMMLAAKAANMAAFQKQMMSQQNYPIIDNNNNNIHTNPISPTSIHTDSSIDSQNNQLMSEKQQLSDNCIDKAESINIKCPICSYNIQDKDLESHLQVEIEALRKYPSNDNNSRSPNNFSNSIQSKSSFSISTYQQMINRHRNFDKIRNNRYQRKNTAYYFQNNQITFENTMKRNASDESNVASTNHRKTSSSSPITPASPPPLKRTKYFEESTTNNSYSH